MNAVLFTYFTVIAILACRHKYILSIIVSIFAVGHLSFIYSNNFYPVSIFVVIVSMSLFLVIFIYLFYLFNSSLEKTLNLVNVDLQTQEEHLNLLTDRDKTLRERNIQLEKGLNEILTIYEYVRKLGSTMNFEEAVFTLEETIVSLTHFSSGKLILFENGMISKVYKISTSKEQNKNIEIFSLKDYEKNVISKMSKNLQIVLYEKGRLSPIGAFPSHIDTLLAFPLVVEKQLLGIITLENLPLVNTDKIHFIALQFAMEIKKTQLYQRVKELSTIDSLTQLYLRRHFLNLLSNEINRACRQNHSISFLMLDVDFFKKYNDEYGHLVGDLVLKRIGTILKDKSREVDLLCRYGGDEFALALPKTSIQDAQIVAERLRRAINEHFFQITNEQFQVSISIGVSTCAPKDSTADGIIEKLIDTADKALYEAKAQGRNKVVVSV